MRVVFFGSPDFAVPSLERLVAAGYDVALVVSQPAKPVSRKGTLTDPPVAALAKRLALPTFQPERLRTDEAARRLVEARADLFVVVAYGKILSERVLSIPRLGAVNVHGSLLPRWRGASPVQAALLSGDAETGVSIMSMDAGLDTGPVYATERTPIGDDDDAGSLGARVAELGAALLVLTLPAIADGSLAPVPQAEALATYCPKIAREDGRVDWKLGAAELVRKGRAYAPWPGLFTSLGGARVKLAGVREAAAPEASGRAAPEPEPGRVLAVAPELVVACGAGAVSVASCQAEGRRALPSAEFARGERVAVGDLFA